MDLHVLTLAKLTADQKAGPLSIVCQLSACTLAIDPFSVT